MGFIGKSDIGKIIESQIEMNKKLDSIIGMYPKLNPIDEINIEREKLIEKNFLNSKGLLSRKKMGSE